MVQMIAPRQGRTRQRFWNAGGKYAIIVLRGQLMMKGGK
jgi:hypothetical protein